jgi:iron complex outermembrane recepter protein
MMVETILSRSVRAICAGGMALGMTAAYAQQAEQPMQKVEVTGSRIPSLNVDGASPVTTISEKDIRIDGAKNVEDLLNNLPQVFADQGANIANGATGTATVNLRGLGCDRTLALINGKRMPQGSALSSCADINEIPAALIKRIDVLTGGAAAVYGAGAVAGVVNFIMKDNFTGVQVEANVSGYNHQQNDPSGSTEALKARNFVVPGDAGFDSQEKEASILMGSNFADNKGNATLFFGYKTDNPLLQAARDFSACSFGSSADGFSCSGSSTSATGSFFTPGKKTVLDAAGTPVAYSNARDQFNYAPYNFYQRRGETYNVASQMHYDVSDKVRVYEEFNFHTYTTDSQIAPSGIFLGDPNHLVITYENPLLSAGWRTALGLTKPGDTYDISGNLGRRNVEGGNRFQHITDTSFREVLGAKGEVNNWQYDVFAQFARVNHSDSQNNYLSILKTNRAMDVVVGPNGTPVCRSVVDGSDPTCVPYNVWRAGGVTQAALNYLYVPGLSGGYTQQNVYGGSLASDLGTYGIKSPMAKDGVGVAFGLERRTEKMVFDPDNEVANGDLAGTGGTGAKPVNGDYTVKEIYGEVKIPLIQDSPMVKSLDLDTTFRHSDYSFDSNTNTYGVGLDWTMNQQARLRGSYQRAVRAPTIFDLYTPQSIGLGGLVADNCAGSTPTFTAAQCAKTGVTAAQYGNLPDNPAGQYNSLLGGNAALSPETADTYTLGVVLNPIKDLTISLDAFKISVKDYRPAWIQTPP